MRHPVLLRWCYVTDGMGRRGMGAHTVVAFASTSSSSCDWASAREQAVALGLATMMASAACTLTCIWRSGQAPLCAAGHLACVFDSLRRSAQHANPAPSHRCWISVPLQIAPLVEM